MVLMDGAGEMKESKSVISFSIHKILEIDKKSSNLELDSESSMKLYEASRDKYDDSIETTDFLPVPHFKAEMPLRPSGHGWWMLNRQNNRRIGHPYQSRAPPKRKKPRASFTRPQVTELEKLFIKKKYLTSSERQKVAKSLDMSDCQVKTWFQNRRTKWKRETEEEREEQRHAITRAMLTVSPELPNSKLRCMGSVHSSAFSQDCCCK